MRRRLLLETTVLAILSLCSDAYSRTWTEDTGKFSIEAEFVSEAGEKVRLKKPDGMIIDVPLAKLCLVDRQFVESQRDNKKGLFAEALSQLDAEQNLEAMLRKEFDDFPQSVLTANLVGRPKIVDKSDDKANMLFTIRLEPDKDAYKAFIERLQPKLDKLAIDKGDFSVVFREVQNDDIEHPDFRYLKPKKTGSINDVMAQWMPKCFKGDADTPELKTDRITLVVASSLSQTGERLECKYYLLDKSVKRLFTDLAFQKGSGQLSLIDARGTSVITERFDLFERFPRSSAGFHGTLISAAGHYYSNRGLFSLFETDANEKKSHAFLFLIGPAFFCGDSNDLAQKPSLTIPLKLEMSLDELYALQHPQVAFPLSGRTRGALRDACGAKRRGAVRRVSSKNWAAKRPF